MERFTTLRSVAAPLPQDDIDTDIIYPARFMLITERDGLGGYAFHDRRFDARGVERPDFVLAREPWRGAQILVTGGNFGCGSSREHALWALAGIGVRAIIAPGFGEIFHGNCLRNGLLPIIVGAGDHAALMADAEAGRTLAIDLAAGEVRREDGGVVGFAIDPERREALLNGWDDIDLVEARHSEDIARFEAAQRAAQPWLWAREGAR
jgi:3-isopropylmalate dehydratase small subunit